MNVLGALYGAVSVMRNWLYDYGLLKAHRLSKPVVSVGNISAGGTGKTPFVIHLGELLKQREIPFDVLTRGYGRETKGVFIVNPRGAAHSYGDEPMLIAQKLRIPVILGESRLEAGHRAERDYPNSRFHLLDDGFQHRALARDFDIVLLAPGDLEDDLLPAGRLREPMSSLRRADAIVLAPGVSDQALPVTGKHLWRMERTIDIPRSVPRRCIAFCGLARPENFFHALREAGVNAVSEITFRDHHGYTKDDMRELVRLREDKNAQGFVTTEKDAIKLGAIGRELAPLIVVPLTVRLKEPERALDVILSAIAQRAVCPA